MQISEFAGVVQSLFDWLISKGFLPACLLAGVLVWISARTNSPHLLLRKMWRLVLGGVDVTNAVCSSFINERDSLMYFRLTTGIRGVGTLAQAVRLINWIRRHDINIDLIRSAGSYFDLDKLSLKSKIPGKKSKLIILVFLATLFLLALAQLALATQPASLITIKSSGNWYGVTNCGFLSHWALLSV